MAGAPAQQVWLYPGDNSSGYGAASTGAVTCTLCTLRDQLGLFAEIGKKDAAGDIFLTHGVNGSVFRREFGYNRITRKEFDEL